MHIVPTHDRHVPQVDDATKLRLLKMSQAYLASLARHESPSQADAEAWRAFFNLHDATIRRFMAKFYALPHEFDDCMQDVWLEVARRLCAFEFDPARGQFESWLYTLVRSKVTDVLRYRSRHPTEPLTDDAESAAAMRAWAEAQADQKRRAQEVALKAAVVELRQVSTTMSYCVFQMRRLERRTFQSIADVLHLTTEQARSRDCRMKRKLRDIIERRSRNPSEPDE
jgi:RNA polymerase sigma factor (sigma-70 family)